MTSKLDQALIAVKAPPPSAQDAISEDMLAKACLHRQLNDALAEAEARMDAGKGIPAEAVIAELKERQKRYESAGVWCNGAIE